ncbi:MAG: TRAP transporter large permease subunit, partial [Chloroflexota bacterium]|nr:TRAP transporter large permease subunit [Chloroflexota bacterium]
RQLSLSIYQSINSYSLLPLALFILMGEAMFRSAIGPQMIDTIDKLLGRLPGRLGLVAVAGGTLIATLTGSAAASTAILGSSLTPEMERRGYKKSMSLGPILGAGGLAAMIPPSAHAVILATISDISLGKLLVAIVVPGLTMAAVFITYIVLRCWLQPSLAPSYEVAAVPWRKKMTLVAKYVLPVGLIIFLVTGVIILGIATPSEAAATGTVGVYILIACYRRLSWTVVKRSITDAMRTSGFVLFILAGAVAYSQILAYTQASKHLIELVMGMQMSPILAIVGMHVVALILGGPLSATAVMMVTLPIFMPIVRSLGFDPVWFGVGFLINMEVSGITPPFGLPLFTMKGVAPPDTTMGDIFRAAIPFACLDVVVIGLLLAFPPLALWLPNVMR